MNTFTLFKLKDDNDGFREKQSNLELQIKASEMEIETQAKRCAQLEGEIKGKVCNFLTTQHYFDFPDRCKAPVGRSIT